MAYRISLTAKKKQQFLERLAATGNVTGCAEAFGLARPTLYRHRKEDSEFAESWDEAIELAVEVLEDEARRRGVEGVEEPVFYKGEICGTVRKYSDTLLIVLLKAHRPEKYRELVDHRHSGNVTLQHLGDRARFANQHAEAARNGINSTQHSTAS